VDRRDCATPTEAGSRRGDEGVEIREWDKEGVAIDTKRFMPQKDPTRPFLPKRWIVERTFLWLVQNRRMSKEYERLPETSEAFIYVAMSRLMARRLAR
jgi:hypothetical protein